MIQSTKLKTVGMDYGMGRGVWIAFVIQRLLFASRCRDCRARSTKL